MKKMITTHRVSHWIAAAALLLASSCAHIEEYEEYQITPTPQPDPSIELESITLASSSTATLHEGESLVISAALLPENAAQQTLSWSVSDESIATLSLDASTLQATLTAVAAGEVTLVATSTNGVMDWISIVIAPKPDFTIGAAGEWEIHSAAGLRTFERVVNQRLKYSDDAALTESEEYPPTNDARLMADIDLEGTPWNPIGSLETLFMESSISSTPYTGTFDGNNKTISGLVIDRTVVIDQFAILMGGLELNVGLFACAGTPHSADEASSAPATQIKDLTLLEPQITLQITGINAGVVATYGFATAAPLVGHASGELLISNCHVEGGSVKNMSGAAAGIAASIGGFTAGTDRQLSEVSYLRVHNSTNKGCAIEGAYTAGIATTARELLGCSNSGKITGSTTSTSIIGGIAVTTSSGCTIKDCHNTGSIEAGNARYTGGVVSVIWTTDITAESALISGCTNRGTINAESTANVGGIVALLSAGRVTNCQNFAPITAKSSLGGIVGVMITGEVSACQNEGALTANLTIGGLVGMAIWDQDEVAGATPPLIAGSTNKGTLRGTKNMGGIIGVATEAILYACANQGEIIPVTDISTITPPSNVGGVVGASTATTATACYSTGALPNATGTNMGGITGAVIEQAGSTTTTTLSSCYWVAPAGGADQVTKGVGSSLNAAGEAGTTQLASLVLLNDTSLTGGVGAMNAALAALTPATSYRYKEASEAEQSTTPPSIVGVSE